VTDKDDQIVALLTEIRNSQREEVAFRKAWADEARASQRVAIRKLTFAALALTGVIVVLGGAVIWFMVRYSRPA
jgi:hypothetical protein